MPVGLHLPELLILLVIALLIFGPKKLPETGAAIGKSIIAFKKGMRELNKENEEEEIQEQSLLEQKRLKLESLERKISSKKAIANTSGSATTHLKSQKRGEITVSIHERLKKIIVDQLGVDESEVVLSASFVKDLNADSLDLIELMRSLEEEFQLQISDEDAKKITIVQEAEDYIKEHLG